MCLVRFTFNWNTLRLNVEGSEWCSFHIFLTAFSQKVTNEQTGSHSQTTQNIPHKDEENQSFSVSQISEMLTAKIKPHRKTYFTKKKKCSVHGHATMHLSNTDTFLWTIREDILAVSASKTVARFDMVDVE